MPLFQPCQNKCDDLEACSINDLNDVSVPEPCAPYTFLICQGDGTIGGFKRPFCHIGTITINHVIPASSNLILNGLVDTYYDNSGMAGGSAITIPMDGYYQIHATAHVRSASSAFVSPFCHIGTTSFNHEIAGGSESILGGLQEVYFDNNDMANGSAITIPVDGYYQVHGTAHFEVIDGDAAAGGYVIGELQVNGGFADRGHCYLQGANNRGVVRTFNKLPMSAGTVLQFKVYNELGKPIQSRVAALDVQWVAPMQSSSQPFGLVQGILKINDGEGDRGSLYLKGTENKGVVRVFNKLPLVAGTVLRYEIRNDANIDIETNVVAIDALWIAPMG